MNCRNCGKRAAVCIRDQDGELYLCVDCNLKFEQAEDLEFQRTAQQLNIVAAAFEAMSGLRGLVPRIPVPPAQTVAVGQVKFNNIHVTNSVVGVLNTGWIETVDNAVTTLNKSGDADVAVAISGLTEAVINAVDAANENKNQVLEILSVIAAEAAAPKKQRRTAAIRPLISEAATLVGGIAGLSQLWERYGPIIQAFFN